MASPELLLSSAEDPRQMSSALQIVPEAYQFKIAFLNYLLEPKNPENSELLHFACHELWNVLSRKNQLESFNLEGRKKELSDEEFFKKKTKLDVGSDECTKFVRQQLEVVFKGCVISAKDREAVQAFIGSDKFNDKNAGYMNDWMVLTDLILDDEDDLNPGEKIILGNLKLSEDAHRVYTAELKASQQAYASSALLFETLHLESLIIQYLPDKQPVQLKLISAAIQALHTKLDSIGIDAASRGACVRAQLEMAFVGFYILKSDRNALIEAINNLPGNDELSGLLALGCLVNDNGDNTAILGEAREIDSDVFAEPARELYRVHNSMALMQIEWQEYVNSQVSGADNDVDDPTILSQDEIASSPVEGPDTSYLHAVQSYNPVLNLYEIIGPELEQCGQYLQKSKIVETEGLGSAVRQGKAYIRATFRSSVPDFITNFFTMLADKFDNIKTWVSKWNCVEQHRKRNSFGGSVLEGLSVFSEIYPNTTESDRREETHLSSVGGEQSQFFTDDSGGNRKFRPGKTS